MKSLLVIDGRMGRMAYARITFISMILLTFGLILLIFPMMMSRMNGIEVMPIGFSIIGALVLMGLGLWSAVAASIRRLHDMGWSAWWLLPCVVPVEIVALAAVIILTLLMSFLPGKPEANDWGPAPA